MCEDSTKNETYFDGSLDKQIKILTNYRIIVMGDINGGGERSKNNTISTNGVQNSK